MSLRRVVTPASPRRWYSSPPGLGSSPSRRCRSDLLQCPRLALDWLPTAGDKPTFFRKRSCPSSRLGLSDALVVAPLPNTVIPNPRRCRRKAIPAVLAGGDFAGRRADRHRQDRRASCCRCCSGSSRPAARHRRRDRVRAMRALILTPTRELAAQVEESVRVYGKYSEAHVRRWSSAASASNPQIAQLRRGVDILVATPGRLLDHRGQRSVDLVARRDPRARRGRPDARHGLHPRHQARDRAASRSSRQNLLFSATFSDEIKALAD